MKSLDKIIKIIRENMVANPPGTSGGYTGQSATPEITGGFDTVGIGKKKYIFQKNTRKNWMLKRKPPIV
jgi:hypothetical protein